MTDNNLDLLIAEMKSKPDEENLDLFFAEIKSSFVFKEEFHFSMVFENGFAKEVDFSTANIDGYIRCHEWNIYTVRCNVKSNCKQWFDAEVIKL